MKKAITIFLAFVITIIYSQEKDISISQQSGYVKYIFKGYESPFSENLTNFKAYLNFNESESLFVTGRFGMAEKHSLGELRSDSENVGYVAPSSSEKGRMVYRNFPKKEIVYNEYKLAVFPPYIVKDNWVEMEWDLLNDVKDIAGYSAKKAITLFRGTKYTAWYTENIALPYGPLKLFGLPGIILELTMHDVDNSDITYHAYEVCYPCENNQKVEPPVENIVKTIQEEVAFKDNFRYYFVTETNRKFEGVGRLYLDELPSEKRIVNKRKIVPEKIYEWENTDTKRVLPGIDYKKMLDPNRNQKRDFPDFPSGQH